MYVLLVTSSSPVIWVESMQQSTQYNIKKKGTKTRHSVSLVVGGLFFVWFCVECQNFLSLPKFGKRSMIIPNRKDIQKKEPKSKNTQKKAVKEENNHFLSCFLEIIYETKK